MSPANALVPFRVCSAILILGMMGTACRVAPQAKEAKYLSRGQALLQSKDYPRAMLEFKNAANVMPKDAEPYYQMGLVYVASGTLPAAIRMFQKAASLNPAHRGAQLKLAELMTLSQDEDLIQQGLVLLKSAFGASPTDPEALDALAVAEWKLGKPSEAGARLEEALQSFPAHLQSSMILARMKLSKNDVTGAEEVLKRAVSSSPTSAPAALALGEFYTLTRQLEKAEPALKKSVQLDATSGPALIALAGVQAAAKKMSDAEQTYRQAAALPEKVYKPLHAMFQYQTGKRQEAVDELKALLKSDPNNRPVRTTLVTAYLNMKQTADAERVLAESLGRNAKDTDALLQRAELRLRSGNLTGAEDDLHQVLHFDPTSAKAHFVLAGVSKMRGTKQLQREELERALQFDPALLDARLELGMILLGGKQAQTALGLLSGAPEYQKHELRWMLARNWTLLSLGNTGEAKAGIEQVLREDRTPAAVFQLAASQYIQHDYSGALRSVDELLKSNSTDVVSLTLMMQIYEAQNHSLQGLEKLKQIAETHPDSAVLQNLLGQWYRRANNLPAARKAFEAAKAADPNFVPADLLIAQLDLLEGHSAPARQRLDRVVNANPADLTAILLSARADEQEGDAKGAIQRYRAALSVDPSNLVALNNLAYMLTPDAPDEALKYAQTAAELAPEDPGVQDTLGWIYYRKGLYSMALRYLKTAVDKEPNPRRQFHLGMSYVKSGDQAAGQKIIREALLKDPNLAKTEQGW